MRKEPEVGFTVIVPSLPGCITYGSTVEEALENAKEAIEVYLESLVAHGEKIPHEEDYIETSINIEAPQAL